MAIVCEADNDSLGSTNGTLNLNVPAVRNERMSQIRATDMASTSLLKTI